MKKKKFKLPDAIVPRDYQESFVPQAQALISSDPDTWHLFTAPTGTGKSIAELLALSSITDSIMITPRLEIIAGMLDKLGHYVYDMTDTELVSLSWSYGIITPIRLRSILAKGELSFMPSVLFIDEAHHDFASTYQDITMYLNGCPKVGLTATPFRGTPKQTQNFRNQWGNKVHSLINLHTAIANGYCTLPTAMVWPLLDDDTIDIQNGEFKLNSVGATTTIQLTIANIVERMKKFYCKKTRLYDMPTMFSVPTTIAAKLLTAALIKSNLPAVSVTQDTARLGRNAAFDSTVRGSTALVQINVVSEGVDLPIKRLIDLSPTMSPVRFLQLLGRIMRPGSTPEYICCCRNLERHCYLLEGLWPNSYVKDAQEAFTDEGGNPVFSRRSGTRVVGLEGLGRFTTTPIHLLDGTVGFLYNLIHTSGFQRTEYIAFLHPNYPDVVKGIKVSSRNDKGEMTWGRWKVVDSLPDLKGCISAKTYPLTDGQVNRWNESSQEKGLNPHKVITAREFQILPFLRDTGLAFS